MGLTNIKKVTLADGDHELDARYWNGHEWSELSAIFKWIGTADTKAPTAGEYKVAVVTPQGGTQTTYYIPSLTVKTGTAKEVAAEIGDVFTVTDVAAEFLCTVAGSGTSTSKATWVELGDSTNFQLVGKTLTSSTPSTNATGSAGGQTATGTATITYSKGAPSTGLAGEHTVDFSKATFTGTKATITSSGSYTPAGSVSAITLAAHSHKVNIATDSVKGVDTWSAGTVPTRAAFNYVALSDDAEDTKDAITELSLTTDSAVTEVTSTTTTVLNGLTSSTTTVVTAVTGASASGTVSAYTGISSSGTVTVNKSYSHADPTFNTATVVTGVTGGTASGTVSVIPSYTHTAASLGTADTGTVTISHSDPTFGTGTFVTGVTAAALTASATSTDGPQYIQDVTHTEASLTGTTTFATAFTVSDAGVLSLNVGTVGISGGSISKTTKYMKISGGTASGTGSAYNSITKAGSASLGGTTTFVTGYPNFSGGSISGATAVTVVTGVTGASASGTTTVLQSVKVAGSITSGGTSSVILSNGLTTTSVVTGVQGGTAKSTATVLTGVTGSTTTVVNSIDYTDDSFVSDVSTRSYVSVYPWGSRGLYQTTAYQITGVGTAPSLSTTTKTFVTSATLDTAGAATVTPTFTGTAATLSVSADYTPAGSISGSQTFASHTHAMGYTDTTVTGTASVAVAAHTHDLSNHTHTVTTKN